MPLNHKNHDRVKKPTVKAAAQKQTKRNTGPGTPGYEMLQRIRESLGIKIKKDVDAAPAKGVNSPGDNALERVVGQAQHPSPKIGFEDLPNELNQMGVWVARTIMRYAGRGAAETASTRPDTAESGTSSTLRAFSSVVPAGELEELNNGGVLEQMKSLETPESGFLVNDSSMTEREKGDKESDLKQLAMLFLSSPERDVPSKTEEKIRYGRLLVNCLLGSGGRPGISEEASQDLKAALETVSSKDYQTFVLVFETLAASSIAMDLARDTIKWFVEQGKRAFGNNALDSQRTSDTSATTSNETSLLTSLGVTSQSTSPITSTSNNTINIRRTSTPTATKLSGTTRLTSLEISSKSASPKHSKDDTTLDSRRISTSTATKPSEPSCYMGLGLASQSPGPRATSKNSMPRVGGHFTPKETKRISEVFVACKDATSIIKEMQKYYFSGGAQSFIPSAEKAPYASPYASAGSALPANPSQVSPYGNNVIAIADGAPTAPLSIAEEDLDLWHHEDDLLDPEEPEKIDWMLGLAGTDILPQPSVQQNVQPEDQPDEDSEESMASAPASPPLIKKQREIKPDDKLPYPSADMNTLAVIDHVIRKFHDYTSQTGFSHGQHLIEQLRNAIFVIAPKINVILPEKQSKAISRFDKALAKFHNELTGLTRPLTGQPLAQDYGYSYETPPPLIPHGELMGPPPAPGRNIDKEGHY